MSDGLDPAPAWHLLRAPPQGELRAVNALRDAGFDAFCPMVSAGQPLWSTYAFARWQTEDPYAWHEVKSAISGGRIMMANGTELPQVVHPIGMVDGWIAAASDDMVVPGLLPVTAKQNWHWMSGKTVRLPIVDLFGRVVRVEKECAVVATELFGRPQMLRKQCATLLVVPEDHWMPVRSWPRWRRR